MADVSILNIPVDQGGIWHYAWAIGLIACTWNFFGFRVWYFLNFVHPYFLARALWLLEAPRLPFGDYTRAFQATAGQAAAEMVIIPYAANVFERWIKWICVAFASIEILGIWFGRAGLMGWESFDMALLALCIPFLVGFANYLLPVAVITILAHHGSTAKLMLLVEIAAATPWIAAILLPAFVAVAWTQTHSIWFDGMERLEAWKFFLKFWATDWGNIFVGTGGGTFMWVSVLLRKANTGVFLHMHNDWLQILFEQGAVGLALALYLFGLSIRRARKDKQLLSAILASGVFGFFYHPLRFFPSAFLVCLVFTRALRGRKEKANDVESE